RGAAPAGPARPAAPAETPYRDAEWPDLPAARAEILALAAAIARTEPVFLLVPPDAPAPPELPPGIRPVPARYGDAWTRDTAPLVARDEAGAPVALAFTFDGWGGRYLMAGDAELGAWLAETRGLPVRRSPLVGEGGGIELDGRGTLMATRDSWLRSPRANPRDEAALTASLASFLGVRAVIWLDGALRNDHTDGHVDTLARFVAPGEVVVMAPERGDPNEGTLTSLASQLEGARDAEGRLLRVSRLPSPGEVRDAEGALLPASYVNYYLANEQVLVPAYGVPADAAARSALEALFPHRRVTSIPARAILGGGGAVHCVTHQIPCLPTPQDTTRPDAA
ncbi:MAG: agmatine deiminase family protein, partial [Myxococcota bacterium]